MFQTNVSQQIVLDVLYIFHLIKNTSVVYGIFENTLISAREVDVFKSFVQHLCNISFNKKSKKRSCS